MVCVAATNVVGTDGHRFLVQQVLAWRHTLLPWVKSTYTLALGAREYDFANLADSPRFPRDSPS